MLSLIPQLLLDGLEDIELDFREDGEERPARLDFLDRELLLRFCCAMETSVPSRLQLAGREPPGHA
jgi:hypothetical protein